MNIKIWGCSYQQESPTYSNRDLGEGFENNYFKKSYNSDFDLLMNEKETNKNR